MKSERNEFYINKLFKTQILTYIDLVFIFNEFIIKYQYYIELYT